MVPLYFLWSISSTKNCWEFEFYLQSRYFWKSSVSWNLMAWSFSGNLTNLGLLDSPLVKFFYLFADASSREHPPGYIFISILPNSPILHYFPQQTSPISPSSSPPFDLQIIFDVFCPPSQGCPRRYEPFLKKWIKNLLYINADDKSEALQPSQPRRYPYWSGFQQPWSLLFLFLLW